MAVPLRLLGGLHRLALDGRAPALRRWYPSTGGHWDAEAAWPEIVLAAPGHADQLRAALDQPPQTNEVGRSAALIGGLLIHWPPIRFAGKAFRDRIQRRTEPAGRPLPLRYPGGKWGPADSPVTIDDAWRGQLPPAAAVRIVERNGYDIAPIDATGRRRGNDAAELRLARPAAHGWSGCAVRSRSPGSVPAPLHRRNAVDAVAGMSCRRRQR